MRFLSVVFVFGLSLTLASCGGKAGKSVPPGTTLLQGAGATFPNPLYQKWARDFSTGDSKTIVYYDSVGSGEGIRRFLKQDVAFGASDRAMSDEQMAKAPHGVMLVPITAGMVALAYNSDGLPKTLRLKRDVYVDIFLGKITRWNDPRIKEANPEFKFPNKQIAVVTRMDKSGTTFAFTNHLAAIRPDWKAGPGVGTEIDWPCKPIQVNGNEGVVGMIQRNAFAIGYAEYGQASRAGLGLAELENKAGAFVAPHTETGIEALLKTSMPENFRVFLPDPAGEKSYPIITYTWMLVQKKYADAETAQAIRGFLTHCLTDGQAQCLALGYVRLPSEIAGRVVAEVAKIK